MFRRALIGSIAATAALLVPTAANATVTVTTVVSRVGLPSPLVFGTDATTCATSSVATTSHIKGPATPPAGTGSLQVSLNASSAAGLTEAPVSKKLVDLTQFSFFSYLPAASTQTNQVTILSQPVNPAGDYYQLTLPLPSNVAAWMPTDAITSTLSWALIDPTTGVVDSGTSTYSAFAAVHSVDLQTIGISAENCGATATKLDLDDLTIGFDDAATTYDFEPLIHTSIAAKVAHHAVVAGHAVTPTATLKTAKTGFASQPVSLYQEPAGAKAYSKVATVTTDAKGVATPPVQHPTVTTSYKWRFVGDATYASTSSAAIKVKVARKLTLHLEKATVSAGTPLDASGTLSPQHAGTTVKLWRKDGKKKVKLAVGSVHGDGTYSIATNLPAGSYLVFTTVKKDKTNTAGRSPKRRFTVS
jgi:hypothetical protein